MCRADSGTENGRLVCHPAIEPDWYRNYRFAARECKISQCMQHITCIIDASVRNTRRCLTTLTLMVLATEKYRANDERHTECASVTVVTHGSGMGLHSLKCVIFGDREYTWSACSRDANALIRRYIPPIKECADEIDFDVYDTLDVGGVE